MTDIIIIAVLAIAVFFIIRNELKKISRGQCTGGCSGCGGCSSECGSAATEKEGADKEQLRSR